MEMDQWAARRIRAFAEVGGVGDKSCECHGGEDVKWPFAALWEFDLNSMVYRMSAEAVRVIRGD